MAQKLLSISLGTTSAKLAEIKLAGKKVQVFSAYDIPLSEGLCDDGVILDVEGLAYELKQSGVPLSDGILSREELLCQLS